MKFDLKKMFKNKKREEKLENLSFVLIGISALFLIVGISVGTFIPGFPVALAIVGSFLVVVGIVIYIISEFLKNL